MSWLRLIALSMSVLIHAAIGTFMLASSRKSIADVLDLGQGTDIVRVEQGIATEGLLNLGDAMQTIESAEVSPLLPPPQSEEVKPEELQDVISSDASSVEEVAVSTREMPSPPQPDAAPVKEMRPPQAAASTQQSSGPAKTGGDAKAIGIYLGQIQKHVERTKVSPPSRRSGTVVMRFTIGVDGKLLSREVVSGSGFKILDDAAIAAIDRAAPFPPIPPKVSPKAISLTQQFTFEAILSGGGSPRARR